jgi:hypothetical protein
MHKRYGPIFKLAARLLKYYLIGLFGFFITCLLSIVLGAAFIGQGLVALLGGMLLRLAAFTLCFMATAIVVESIRQ